MIPTGQDFDRAVSDTNNHRADLCAVSPSLPNIQMPSQEKACSFAGWRSRFWLMDAPVFE
jgi:hypothetical protein